MLPDTRGEAHSAAFRAADRAAPVCTQLDPAGVGTASNWKPSLSQAALRTVPRCGLGEREVAWEKPSEQPCQQLTWVDSYMPSLDPVP